MLRRCRRFFLSVISVGSESIKISESNYSVNSHRRVCRCCAVGCGSRQENEFEFEFAFEYESYVKVVDGRGKKRRGKKW